MFFFLLSLSYFDINNGSKFIVNYYIIVIVLYCKCFMIISLLVVFTYGYIRES